MKNYLIAAVLFLFISLEMRAQKISAIGIYFSPAHTQQTTRSNSDLSWMEEEWDDKESGKFGYALGGFVEKDLNNRLNARVGIGFSSVGERLDSLLELGVDKFNNDYRFLEMPIAFCYSFGKNNYSKPYISLGYSLNYFLNKRTTYSLANTNRDEILLTRSDVSTIGHAARFAFGYDFVLDKKISLKAEFFASQFLSSLTKNGINRFPVSLGFSLQVRRKV